MHDVHSQHGILDLSPLVDVKKFIPILYFINFSGSANGRAPFVFPFFFLRLFLPAAIFLFCLNGSVSKIPPHITLNTLKTPINVI